MQKLVLVCLLAATACTQPNPNLCCVDEADCSSHGIAPGSTCSDGLVCRGNQCIAETCSNSANCEAAAPYCLANQLCSSTCDDNAQCPGFGQDAADKFCSNGACVECLGAPDCPMERPVCDANACRGCKLDSECASSACADNGACVVESSVLYVDNAGLDAGECTRQAPCKTIQFAVQGATPSRSHIVLLSATYIEDVQIDNTVTFAAMLTIHGGGATLMQPPAGDSANISVFNVATTLRDLKFAPNGGFGTSISTITAPVTLTRIEIENTAGIRVGANAIIRDLKITNTTSLNAIVVDATSHLLLERAVIRGGATAIGHGSNGGVISASNVLIFDTTNKAIDVAGLTGAISFATIVDSTSGVPAIVCDSGVTFQSSIVWTPNSTTPISGSCPINTLIVGPTQVAGASNADPKFADLAGRDFHLSSTSPAIDLVDSGPMLDVEGTARPQGVRFDIGAYEAH